MQFFGGTPGCCGSWPTGAKFFGSSVQMRWMRSLDMRDHSMPVASVPTWCAMPAARGEKMVRSEPRSFCSFNCGSTLFNSCSSVIPSSLSGLAHRIGQPGELLVAKREQRLRLGGVVAVDVDDHRSMLALPVVASALREMKREGRKIVGVVAWDYQMALIADRAGVDLVSVGDSAGVHLWGREPDDITIEEMLILCRAVRRGVQRALVSVDLPAHEQNFEAALRLKECGADTVKLVGSADLVRSVVRAGVPVFAEFHGGKDDADRWLVRARCAAWRTRARRCSTSATRAAEAGAAVARAVKIPVVGGLGGGPWLDGRMRLAHGAIGYGFANVGQAGRPVRERGADQPRRPRRLRRGRARLARDPRPARLVLQD